MRREEIDYRADVAMDKLIARVPEVKKLSDKAKGVLVFPSVIKGGFGFGGEYGDGVLLEKDKENKYYNMLSISFGWQMGLQARSVMFFFMTDDALTRFKLSEGFKVGVDASIAVLTLDTGIQVDDKELLQPVIALVTDRQGLMYNLSLEGTKITRVVR